MLKNVENEIKLCETKLQDEQEKIKKYKVHVPSKLGKHLMLGLSGNEDMNVVSVIKKMLELTNRTLKVVLL